MPALRRCFTGLLLPLLCAATLAVWTNAVPAPQTAPASSFKAGAASVDISPVQFPVIVNGMFTGRTATRVVDPLYAKALVLDDGRTRIGFAVVDTCMMPRALIDKAKAQVAAATGIPADHLCISATHTHSAPSAMGCLGSAVDPAYAAWLPGKIAESLIAADKARVPARAGWGAVDAWNHTHNRRWIRRPDRMLEDPFGQKNVRAHMHPGYESPDVTGPSGPVDPQLSVFGVQTADGKPLAALANFSMHYYQSELVSSDYFGKFAGHFASQIGADTGFTGMMSQGTSGDLMWMDYSAPKKEIGYDAYARELAELASAAWKKIEWTSALPLSMKEQEADLDFRVPDAARLKQSIAIRDGLNGRAPQSMSEVYALEAIYLHERPRASLKVQAIGIGGLGIVALPNEVFALTGLKLKERSPFPHTFVMELANGAEGYIPPPEQHKLGGYTTWPARTAGLVPEAEPKLVATALDLLSKLLHPDRPRLAPESAAYPAAVAASRPMAYWRMEEAEGPAALNATGAFSGQYEDGVALYLPGADARTGFAPSAPLVPNAFGGARVNRSPHFAGGRLRVEGLPPPGASYAIEGWFWNGLPADARLVTGYFFSRGANGAEGAPGDHLGIGGTHAAAGKLIFFNGNQRNQLLTGKTEIEWRKWHHVVFVREGRRVRVWLDGNYDPEIDGEADVTTTSSALFIGGRSDNFANWEGKIDEVAFYDRALTYAEAAAHFAASGIPSSIEDAAVPPERAAATFETEPGLTVSLAAAEPLVESPCAITWDAAGAMYVAENRGYPAISVPPMGRIAKLTDGNHDGRYDTRTDFVTGLTFPNGVLSWRGGLIVTCAPDVLFFKDNDGDGIAEERRVLLTGFATNQSTQLRVNDPEILPDGSIAFAGGLSGGVVHDPRFPDKTADSAKRDVRWHPDTGALELMDGKSQWGHEFDAAGDRIICMNRIQAQHVVLPGRYLERNPHLAFAESVQNCPEEMFKPISGGESAAARIYPASDQLVIKDAHYGTFSAAGAILLWRADGLLPLHYEGRLFSCDPSANLVHVDELVHNGAAYLARRSREKVEFLRSRDNWFRPVFQRQAPDGALYVVDMYRKVIDHPEYMPGSVREHTDTDAGRSMGRIWRIQSTAPLHAPKREDLPPGLDSASPSQRILALRKAEPLLKTDAALASRVQALASDADPRVRFQCALSLGETGNAAKIAPALAVIAARDGGDRWTRAAVLSSAAQCAPELLQAALEKREIPAAFIEEAARVAVRAAPDKAAALSAKAADASLPFAIRAALCLGLGKAPASDALADAAAAALRPGSQDRLLAIRLLRLFTDRNSDDRLAALIDAHEPAEIQTAAAQALFRPEALLTKDRWGACGPAVQQIVLRGALQNDAGRTRLVEAMEAGVLPALMLSPQQREQLLKSAPQLKARAAKLFADNGGADRRKVFEDWKPVLQLPGSAAKGREVFKRACATCHRLDREGFAVGPDLFDIRNQPKENALYHIIIPNAEIYQGFQSCIAVTRDGRTFAGMLAAESDTSITLRMQGGIEESIVRSDLQSLSTGAQSLMPDNLEQTMTRQEMADLLAHLRGEE